ncbi:helix-turn-helix domain-containing protein [Kribbella sandramycini]|uniref:Transcriptional regulator with XRE-family HTH domain n=1 Tax=Kribbella sandramycini TaxID=60450 RepID=A0A841SMP0_9ACTN|nr:helix-turn-helix transcriptional regulator [Kribbella sandramycini]MBB6570800.1 transcriptional regulator with XRE-family HTH domain [Kribbella sandramycini]
MTFGKLLRSLREDRGWSLGDLAGKVPYSRSHLSNLETGRRAPVGDVARLCDVALNARGDLIAAANMDYVARIDGTPWQTAELLQRIQISDASDATIASLNATVYELCCQYNLRDAIELRAESHGWLERVGKMLRKPVGLKAHQELLVSAGYLALLAGCTEYDLGMRATAEATRTASLELGIESGHAEITGWAHEMSAWFALTQGRYQNAIDAAQKGQLASKGTSVYVQLLGHEAKARARLGQPGLDALLDEGQHYLEQRPEPERTEHHFVIDSSRWNYHSMDIHRLAGNLDKAREYATSAIESLVRPDGTEISPMRVSEARLTLAVVASREGDLEKAVDLGIEGLQGSRKSLPTMLMVAGELDAELQQRYPKERLPGEFREAVRAASH